MAEDDWNPYRFIQKNPEKLGDLQQFAKFTAWNEGDEHGQLHPSPQTIKKIETKFAENVKEEIMDAIRKKTGRPPKFMFYWEINEVIDNTLKEKEGDD